MAFLPAALEQPQAARNRGSLVSRGRQKQEAAEGSVDLFVLDDSSL